MVKYWVEGQFEDGGWHRLYLAQTRDAAEQYINEYIKERSTVKKYRIKTISDAKAKAELSAALDAVERSYKRAHGMHS